jgi:quinohemoprotein ethanol dehydrogenase
MRSSMATNAEAWRAVVMDGALADNGMISFAPYLTTQQAESVRAYVLEEARKAARKEADTPPSGPPAPKSAEPKGRPQ